MSGVQPVAFMSTRSIRFGDIASHIRRVDISFIPCYQYFAPPGHAIVITSRFPVEPSIIIPGTFQAA